MTLSRPFYEPFKDIVGTSVVDGHPIVWSIVVAMVAFAILHSVLRALLGFLAARG
jgi:hypothetical protein